MMLVTSPVGSHERMVGYLTMSPPGRTIAHH